MFSPASGDRSRVLSVTGRSEFRDLLALLVWQVLPPAACADRKWSCSTHSRLEGRSAVPPRGVMAERFEGRLARLEPEHGWIACAAAAARHGREEAGVPEAATLRVLKYGTRGTPKAHHEALD